MRILVVDDDRGSRLVAQATVLALGHECVTAADGDAAGALVQARPADATSDGGRGRAGAACRTAPAPSLSRCRWPADGGRARTLISGGPAVPRAPVPPSGRCERSGSGHSAAMTSIGNGQRHDRAAAQEHRRLTEPGRTRGGGATSAGQRLAGTRAVRERLAAVERTTWGRQG